MRNIACSSSKLSAPYEESQRLKFREVDRKAVMEQKRLQMKKCELILSDSCVASTLDTKVVMKLPPKIFREEYRANFQQPEIRNLNIAL
jgi:hypothetical protein